MQSMQRTASSSNKLYFQNIFILTTAKPKIVLKLVISNNGKMRPCDYHWAVEIQTYVSLLKPKVLAVLYMHIILQICIFMKFINFH